jgi:hypothetical protein
MTRALAALSAVALLQACAVPEDGPMMAPGEDCIRCHGDGGGEEEDGPRWTVAGTVYPSEDADPGAGLRGASIWIQDSNGKSFTLRSNKAGNFYTAESLAFPIRVAVDGELRHGQTTGEVDDLDRPILPHGSCNRCHAPGGEDPDGRVHP